MATLFSKYRTGFLFTILCIFICCTAAAQDGRPRDSAFSRPIDTTLSPNGQLLSRLERTYFVLNRINNAADQSFDTKSIESDLPTVANNIKIIQSSLNNPNTLTLRNLQLFQVTAQDMMSDLRDWRNTLTDYNKSLITMNASIESIANDTLIKVSDESTDSTLRKVYAAKLVEMKAKLKVSDSISNVSLARIDKLQSNVSDNFLAAVDLRRNIRKQLKKFSSQAFSKEQPYLWEAAAPDTAVTRDKSAFSAERKIMQYYFQNSSQNRMYMLLIGLLFFIWTFFSYRFIKKRSIPLDDNEFKIHFLKAIPFFSSCVVMLTIAPFFDLHPPANYVAFLQFLLLVALTFLLGRSWPKRLFYCWLSFAILFLLFSCTRFVFHSITGQRWWYIIVNVLSIAAGFTFYPRIGKSWTLSKMIRVVTGIFILLNAAAIFVNMFGRVSLAETFTGAATFGITQVIGLAVFIQIIVEAIYLQLIMLRVNEGVAARFNFEAISQKVKRVLSILSLILWLIVFTTNLNMYDDIYASITRFLNQKRMVGSTGFTFENIALFFIIIYVANLIQKYVAYIWDNGKDSLIPIKKGSMGSRLLFTRLILLTLGFLLAVAASGLPLDKITIILGALGVGIGLGLQNIVNNLVSGIVLIFERPLDVGDSIEVKDKKGVVKEIGLRSTKLISDEGAEIIIPNGDFLSEHVINWTLTNNYVRLEVVVFIPREADLVKVNKLILDTIAQNKNLYHQLEPGIIIDNINYKRIKLKVQFWYTDIRQEDEMKSEVLAEIREVFMKNGLELI